uniref:NADH dehydrogenase subunit 4L n=2 Tax=Meretrix TaxID=74490 RepID=C8CP65_MERMT|nr:NADH dehydrogenase subunit 4L [Meretrix petechialis]YP_003162827.1 NADH dehydrogenase subunit 4L [Meretrix meretrix]ABV53324.1 NADH dehydrogenase subunit 4L [Meretrix petechialis]ACU68433.1 NADH dehydrogenase subunit 4L [Meretrix meretrix]
MSTMVLDICFFFFFFALFHLFFQHKVFLNLLLTFELLSLLVYMVSMCLGGMSLSLVSFHVCNMILCFSVVESVMGLALLILCSRLSSKKQVSCFSFLKF